MSEGPKSAAFVLSGALARGELRSLRRRVVVAVSALVAIVLAVNSAVLVFFSRDHLRAEIEERARSYAALAAAPLCDAYADYFQSGFSKFRELVLELEGLSPDLEDLAIYDTEGRLLFHSVELEAPGRAAPPEVAVLDRARLLRAVAGLELDAWTEDDPFGRPRYLVVAPHVEAWGSHRYSALFFVSYDHLRTANRSTAWGIAGLAVFALLLGAGCALVLAAQSLEPLKKLTRGARRLAAGHLDERIALATRDEFQVLSETLDQMAEKLATTVDDLERSNQRLGRLNQELQQLDRLKSDLLANVSHELRTPLTAIGGYVEAMEEGLLGELDATQLGSLRVVRRNVGRLRAMIDQLLSYSRMEQSRLRVELQPFDLAPVVKQAASSLRAIHGDRLDLRLDCPDDLPQVYGDPGAIAQVLENLLTNAVKFSPERGTLEVTVAELGAGVEVAVKDQGVGISAAEQEKIFDRFYQVDASARRKFGGMGLGLAIVKELLELHHSEIGVESSENRGSTFKFNLPSALERTGRIQTPGGRCIAFVDDDPGFVQTIAHYLSQRGFQVETAATAAQGLAMIERVRPEAVLVDRLLPDDDGFELIARLAERAATRHVPVIVISVRQERTLALRLGAAAYLSKPVAPEVVEKTLLDVLAKRAEASAAGVV